MSTTSDKIRIIINGDERDIDAGKTVADLLTELNLNPRLVVVEHNREILDRSSLDAARVAAGDVFEVVHFVGGG
ncbi:MAG: sulfur carrier protein ThiS [Gemmatimonadota bacterium]